MISRCGVFLIALLTIAAPVFGFATVEERVQAAAGYLEGIQNPDGSWGGKTAVRDTSEVLQALNKTNPASQAVQLGSAWMQNLSPENLDYLARKVAVAGLTGAPDQTELDRLVAALKTAGSGASECFQTDILSTVIVARTLNES